MAFKNRIRLPIKLHKPQFIDESEKYRKANGVSVTLFAVVRKVYEGLTDRIPEKLHERLKIALVHDSVIIEGDKYVGAVTQEGSYDIEWSDFMSHPLAQAKFKAEVTPFNATNSNCGTCAEYTQVVANDDVLVPLSDGSVVHVNVLINDDVCCYPAVISITSFNSTYVDIIQPQPNNNIVIQIKNPVPSGNGIVLATYRVTCPNGMYDEANIIADINGSQPAECLAPTSISANSITTTNAHVEWVAPAPPPLSYSWGLYAEADLGTLIADGNTTDLFHDFTGLTPNTAYRVYVNSLCDLTASNAIYVSFTTLPEEVSGFCGQYQLENTSFDNYSVVTYTDCEGISQNINIPPITNRLICALQTSPGNPVEITTAAETTITYIDLC